VGKYRRREFQPKKKRKEGRGIEGDIDEEGLRGDGRRGSVRGNKENKARLNRGGKGT
jgi:hypothetical protein